MKIFVHSTLKMHKNSEGIKLVPGHLSQSQTNRRSSKDSKIDRAHCNLCLLISGINSFKKYVLKHSF